jgi:hypothetical protein
MAEQIDHELHAQGLRLVAEHIRLVQRWMGIVARNLNSRAVVHDQSKYSQEELGLVLGKPSFDKFEYMSVEERAALAAAQESLKHHYEVNSHHPEHFVTYECGACFKEYPKGTYKCSECGYDVWEQSPGVRGMSLLDLIEMMADWKAASETSGKNSSFAGSIEFGKERWHLSDEMVRILGNTGRELGWME